MGNNDVIYVDCFGRSHRTDITTSIDGKVWRFLYDKSLKQHRHFSCGLFLDRALLNPNCLFRYPPSRRVIVLAESPQEPQFSRVLSHETCVKKILTHDKNLLERGCPYERFDYGVSWVNKGVPLESPQKTRLVSFIGSIQHPPKSGYALRREIATELLNDPFVDCFGKGICEIQNKREGLEKYFFSIAMENTQKDFYYTEKLID